MHKVLVEITRRIFNIIEFKEIMTQLFYKACGRVEFEVRKHTIIFKYYSGCTGVKYHDIKELTTPAMEEVLVLIGKLKDLFRTGYIVMTFKISIQFKANAACAAREA